MPPPARPRRSTQVAGADEHASAGLYSVTLARYNIGIDNHRARRSAILPL